jgi:hypothetical protein
MMCFIDYISAKRRLKEADKTIYMMGGRDECQDMILAQRDMIELEMDYYELESQKLITKLLVTAIVGISVYSIYRIVSHVG